MCAALTSNSTASGESCTWYKSRLKTRTQGQGWLPGDRIASNSPEVNYSKVMESDRELLKWMTSMEHYGFCFVRRVPVIAEEMHKLLVNKLGAINLQHWTLPSDLTKINVFFPFAMLS